MLPCHLSALNQSVRTCTESLQRVRKKTRIGIDPGEQVTASVYVGRHVGEIN